MRFYLSRKKRPGEKVQVSIDFTDDVGNGDTAASCTATCTDITDPNTDLSATMLENVTRNGNVVLASLKAGTAGKSYVVKMTVTTTAGFTYESDIVADVRSDA